MTSKNGKVKSKEDGLYHFIYDEPGDSMINFFRNKGLVEKAMSLYPKSDPQYKWLSWGSKNAINFKQAFTEQTHVAWPTNIREGIAKVIRFTVLLTLLDEQERIVLMREGRSDEVIRKHCLT